ncbi:IS481 family transposase [Synechococcus sp. Tobar12-5m-g]|uniref:IS481 family transposase n=1 Tax=unclassified Synechococcus TaxID=2626047 RepID=UPI0020CC1135|nr:MULTISPECIES: IS481 family transposase [unclassified Synechococcus]MCP9773900.1 IS481 family transposase [Synechococcus sp. Tobar12-5m-g]MCP9874876.1 IS481 family transposase [Synechococcus sp. Cruz CV-v-12]
MHSHPNARLTPIGRERLICRHLDDGVPLKALAAEAGISLRSAYKWLARFRDGGLAALADRRSVRRTQRRTLDPQRLQQAVDLRHQRCTLRRIARALQAPLSTVGRVMNTLGLGRLKNLEPKVPVRRYQWERPGDMIHVDTKQLARFERVGHRITGDRRQGCSRGAAYEKVHVAIDDATRLSYVEVLADEQRATTVGFLARAVGWFSEQGITCRRILSNNGPAYRSGDWRKACRALDLKPIRTKPYTPQTNGKAERFIKTLLAEWAYVMAYQTSQERNHWLPRYLGIYNSHRCHMALGGLTPQQSLQRLLIAE